MNFSVLSALLFLCFGSAGAAQTPAVPALIPLRVSSPPVIDGKLDDAVWQQAPFVTGFKTFSPDFGRDMSEPTRAFYAYDRENIYFAFEALDSHPELIKAAVSSRDSIRPDDWVCINLDTFGDSQALYAFYVNPLGIQGDSRYAGGQEDYGFDTVWYSAGRKTDSGYTVEIRIPLKSIRFSHADPVRMAIIFERRISRHSENGTYPPMKPERGMAFLTQMQPIVYEGVTHYTLWELLPAVTYSRRSARYESASEIYAGEKFDTSGVQLQARSQVTKQFRLEGRYRNGKGIFYAADPYQGLKEDASAAVTWQASENWEASLSLTYSDFRRSPDAVRVYDYAIIRSRNTYQVNRYLFFRGIAEHNSFRKRWILDLLASFTYIPGTVVHLGYGSLFEKLRWENGAYVPADSYLEMERGLFFKASYLWRR